MGGLLGWGGGEGGAKGMLPPPPLPPLKLRLIAGEKFFFYSIYLAIRWGFSLSRMTANN